MRGKAEYIFKDRWTPIGRCYLCDTENEIRLITSESTGNLYSICTPCIKAHEGFPATEQPNWYMTVAVVLAISIVIVSLIFAVVAFSGIAGGP